MIHDAIEYIRREVRDYLTLDDSEVIAGNIHMLKENNNQRGIYASLVNLEEETTLKNTAHYVRQNNAVFYHEPPVFLNLFLLFAANFDNYATSLLRLSQLVELFQSKRVFSADNDAAANPFPADLQKLIFDFFNLNVEQLNYLWAMQGGAYFPSVLYKVRLVKIQKEETVPVAHVEEIKLETKRLTTH